MKRNLFFPTLISVVSLLAISSIGATYAWYQYQTFVNVEFGGSSLDAAEVFEVGLVSDVALDTEKHNFTYEEIDGKKIYWINGTATGALTQYYLEKNGYGTDHLAGVTSGRYTPGETMLNGSEKFSLKRSPSRLNNYVGDLGGYFLAEKSNYLHFELAFRSSVVSTGGQSAVDVAGVRLSKVNFYDYGNDLEKAVRIHFCDSYDATQGFIFNPSENEDGLDRVGGPLDLEHNGVFDVYTQDEAEYEYPYGEYEKLVYNDFKTTDGVYKPTYDDDGNCFTGNHLNGVYAIDMENSVASTSQYYGRQTVIENGKAIAKPSTYGLAFFNMDIYLEGWDEDFTDKNMEKAFQCNLEFESI